MKGLQVLTWLSTFFVGAVTLLPFSSGDHWTIRIWDFPRLQILVLALITLVLMLKFVDKTHNANRVALVLCTLACLYQALCIWPYTPLHSVQTESSLIKVSDQNIRILTANVLESNSEPDPLRELIKAQDPDIILLTEVDQSWVDKLSSFERDYPHQVLHPLSNTYGIALYSRLKLKGSEIKFLVEADIPSIFTTIVLKSNHQVKFVGLHPRPPGPTQSEDTEERDAELIVIAKMLAGQKRPVIVAGDLNDVAWSRTTSLFKKISGTLDPRVGRGMFNSFHAHYPFLRFPLDHVFHSEHFRLAEITCLPSIESDHFPLYVNLSLETTAPLTQEEPEASPQDIEAGEEILRDVEDLETDAKSKE